MSLKLEVNFAATLKDGPAIQPNKAPIKDIVEVRSKKLLIYRTEIPAAPKPDLKAEKAEPMADAMPKPEYIWKRVFAPDERPWLSFIAVSVPRFTYEKCGKDGKVEKVSGVAFSRHLIDDTKRADYKGPYTNAIFVDDLYDNLLLVHRSSQSLMHLTPDDAHALFIRASRCMFDVAKPADPLVVTVVYGLRS